jgi:hypothetical protein
LDKEVTLLQLTVGPLVLRLGGEVVLNVERLTDLLGRLASDHVGDGLATDIEEWNRWFVKVDQGILFIPLFDPGGHLTRVGECLAVLVVCGEEDHVGDGLAANGEEGLHVNVVGGEDELMMVDLHELLVPLFDVGGLLAGIGVIDLSGRWAVLVLGIPLEGLLEDVLDDLE